MEATSGSRPLDSDSSRVVTFQNVKVLSSFQMLLIRNGSNATDRDNADRSTWQHTPIPKSRRPPWGNKAAATKAAAVPQKLKKGLFEKSKRLVGKVKTTLGDRSPCSSYDCTPFPLPHNNQWSSYKAMTPRSFYQEMTARYALALNGGVITITEFDEHTQNVV